MEQNCAGKINSWLDNLKFNRFHGLLMFLTGITVFFDGFDSQLIAYIMPQLMKEWHLTPVMTGSLASYGFIGLMVGAIGFGLISDRIGRKKSLMLALACFTLFSGAAYFAPSFKVFVTLRVLAGLGMGGALPISITLISEFAPAKIRGKVVTGMFAGFNLGWAGAGLVSMAIVPRFGWRPVLLVGLLPILIIPVLSVYLPESLRFLGAKKRFGDAITEVRRLEKFAGLQENNWVPEDFVQPKPQEKVGLAVLFNKGFRRMTVLIGLTYLLSFIVIYGLSSWLPTILMKAGYPLVKSYSYGVVQGIGASLGGFLLGWAMDRFGRKAGLFMCYVAGGISVWVFGFASSNLALFAVGAATGLFVMSSPIALHVITGETYPTYARSTGIGWALTVGRVGSILGPLIGGSLQNAGLSFSNYFLIFAVPCFLCGLIIMGFRVNVKGETLEVVTERLTTA